MRLLLSNTLSRWRRSCSRTFAPSLLHTTMINTKQAQKYCCEDISLIENYDEAISDQTQTWDIHHRGEILPCGKFSKDELIEFGLYWKRPASELVFMTQYDHISMHMKGHISKNKGKPSWNHGMHGMYHHSEESKMKMSQMRKGKLPWNTGKKLSDEHKQKDREAMLGMLWWNDGVKNVRAKECPPGFVRGCLQLKRKKKQ